jgi:hypothetical protein
MILDSLRMGEQITPLDALKKFGCFRLSARVHDLKRQGHAISTKTMHTLDGKRVAIYSMKND